MKSTTTKQVLAVFWQWRYEGKETVLHATVTAVGRPQAAWGRAGYLGLTIKVLGERLPVSPVVL